MITPVSRNVNFKGYDVRPLRALAMRNTDGFELNGIVQEMRQIGAEHGFKVFLEDAYSSFESEEEQDLSKKSAKKFGRGFIKKFAALFSSEEKPNITPWMQDCVYFTKDGILAANNDTESLSAIADTFKVDISGVPKSSFIKGGNLYVLKDGDEEKILVGAAESPKKVGEMFPGRKVVRIPQADFHIDLFVRPLRDNVILAADDDMTLDILKNGAAKLKELVSENGDDKSLKEALDKLNKTIWQMETGRWNMGYKDTKKVIKTLEDNGFQVVRTPGRVFKMNMVIMNIESSLENKLNFMNAIALEDEEGELVYISNKSNLLKELGISQELAEKIGLDFEAEFKKSVAQYIKPENIYFVEGAPHKFLGPHKNLPNILQYLNGGIHCLCAEVPKDNTDGQK